MIPLPEVPVSAPQHSAPKSSVIPRSRPSWPNNTKTVFLDHNIAMNKKQTAKEVNRRQFLGATPAADIAFTILRLPIVPSAAAWLLSIMPA